MRLFVGIITVTLLLPFYILGCVLWELGYLLCPGDMSVEALVGRGSTYRQSRLWRFRVGFVIMSAGNALVRPLDALDRRGEKTP